MLKNGSIKEKWEAIIAKLSEQFADGDELNLDGVIYLIGVQELGQGHRAFKKDEKVNLMHIAICKLLEPYGFGCGEGTTCNDGLLCTGGDAPGCNSLNAASIKGNISRISPPKLLSSSCTSCWDTVCPSCARMCCARGTTSETDRGASSTHSNRLISAGMSFCFTPFMLGCSFVVTINLTHFHLSIQLRNFA